MGSDGARRSRRGEEDAATRQDPQQRTSGPPRGRRSRYRRHRHRRAPGGRSGRRYRYEHHLRRDMDLLGAGQPRGRRRGPCGERPVDRGSVVADGDRCHGGRGDRCSGRSTEAERQDDGRPMGESPAASDGRPGSRRAAVARIRPAAFRVRGRGRRSDPGRRPAVGTADDGRGGIRRRRQPDVPRAPNQGPRWGTEVGRLEARSRRWLRPHLSVAIRVGRASARRRVAGRRADHVRRRRRVR